MIVPWVERRVGLRYGFATIASIAIAVAFNLPYRFEHRSTYICSGLVASALTSAGIDLGDDPAWIMPAQIAAWGKIT
jgi:cell wall-associated NlpC family hydrolase